MYQDKILVRQLGLQPYEPVSLAMHEFTDTRDENSYDEIWLVEHYPVFTQGQAGKAEHVLMPGDIPVIQSDRGGQVTYHGPGQLVAYLLLDVRRLGFGVRELVSRIEQTLIDLLRCYKELAAFDDYMELYYDQRMQAMLPSQMENLHWNSPYHEGFEKTLADKTVRNWIGLIPRAFDDWFFGEYEKKLENMILLLEGRYGKSEHGDDGASGQ